MVFTRVICIDIVLLNNSTAHELGLNTIPVSHWKQTIRLPFHPYCEESKCALYVPKHDCFACREMHRKNSKTAEPFFL